MQNNEVLRKPAVQMVDNGLRQYLIKVFNYMGLGLCVTALAAYIGANTSFINWMFSINQAQQTVSLSAFGYLITFAPLLMIFAFGAVLRNGSTAAVQAMFWCFSAVMGLSLSTICLAYSAHSITRVFLITAAVFGTMSLYGYTTQRDLTKLGTFLYVGVIGLVIASVVNIFLQSTGLMYAISYIAVVAFTGLTAYDIQNIKNLYYMERNTETINRLAVSGALNLYLDFVNLFIALMNIMGDRR